MLAGQTTTAGKASSRLERRQRLHGLAEALLVGDERAPALERVAHARALEGVQLAAELEAVQLRVLGVRQRDGARGAVVLGQELVEQLAHALLDLDVGSLGDELGELRAPARRRPAPPRPRRVADEEAPRAGGSGAPRTAC